MLPEWAIEPELPGGEIRTFSESGWFSRTALISLFKPGPFRMIRVQPSVRCFRSKSASEF
jgi:hypothetical protein